MTFESSGSLTTDERQVGTSTSWDTQTDWAAYQSISNLQIENGVVKLASAIPDSVVSRPADTNSTANDPRGLVVNPNTEWPKIEARVSSNTDNMTTAELYETSSDTLVWSENISLTGGDVFTIDATLSAGTDYSIMLSGDGNGPSGYISANFPYTGSDVDIVAGANGDRSTTQDFAFVIEEVGNITGSL